MIPKTALLLGVLCLLTSPDHALADDTYLYIPVRSLELSGDPLPQGAAATERPGWNDRFDYRDISRFYQPYAVGDRGEEIYMAVDPGTSWNPRRSFVENLDSCCLVIKTAHAASATTGKIYLPKLDYSGFLVLDFAARHLECT